MSTITAYYIPAHTASLGYRIWLDPSTWRDGIRTAIGSAEIDRSLDFVSPDGTGIVLWESADRVGQPMENPRANTISRRAGSDRRFSGTVVLTGFVTDETLTALPEAIMDTLDGFMRDSVKLAPIEPLARRMDAAMDERRWEDAFEIAAEIGGIVAAAGVSAFFTVTARRHMAGDCPCGED